MPRIITASKYIWNAKWLEDILAQSYIQLFPKLIEWCLLVIQPAMEGDLGNVLWSDRLQLFQGMSEPNRWYYKLQQW